MCKTVEGKPLVPLTLALISRGVTIVIVPLVGLGSDEVEKANMPEPNIEAHHAEEHKFEDARKLRTRLENILDEEAKHVSIILFISPQSLYDKIDKNDRPKKSGWCQLVEDLVDKTSKDQPTSG